MFLPHSAQGTECAHHLDEDPPVREQEGLAAPRRTWSREPKLSPEYGMPSPMGCISPGTGNRVQQQQQTQQVVHQVWDTSKEPSQERKEMEPETGVETRLKHRSEGTSKTRGQRQDWK